MAVESKRGLEVVDPIEMRVKRTRAAMGRRWYGSRAVSGVNIRPRRRRGVAPTIPRRGRFSRTDAECGTMLVAPKNVAK